VEAAVPDAFRHRFHPKGSAPRTPRHALSCRLAGALPPPPRLRRDLAESLRAKAGRSRGSLAPLARVQAILGIDKLIAGSPDRRNVARLRRVGLDLLAQPLDQRVDAALGDVRLAAPDALHQRVAAEDDAAVARQHVEQVE